MKRTFEGRPERRVFKIVADVEPSSRNRSVEISEIGSPIKQKRIEINGCFLSPKHSDRCRTRLDGSAFPTELVLTLPIC
jgi:hypothetical protein